MPHSFNERLFTAALAETVRELDDGRSLPAQCYCAPTILQWEWERLFARSWLAIARESDLPEKGDFLTQELGEERLLLVRGDGGGLHAFYNVCRHRGARLVEEPRGRLKSAIVCPYHAWSYTLDGRLRGAPGMAPSAQLDDCNLIRVPLAVRDGFVFVHLERDPVPFAEARQATPDLSRFGLERLQRAARLDYRIDANWKLVCENYSECYHCPRVHPQLDRLSTLSGGGFEAGAGFNGGPMRLRTGVDTLSTSGHSGWPLLCPAAAPDGERLVHYYLLYPNQMLGLHPDYVTVHTVWPLAPAASHIRCEILVPAETRAFPGFDPAPVVDFWHETNEQDWTLCERVQRGVASRGYRPGPYHPSERCVHAFDRWYAAWLRAALSA